jgi:Tfp pilus assembly protein PilF
MMSASRGILPVGAGVAVAFLFLLSNSAYLAAYATPSLFYFANVVLHAGLGVLLTVVCVWRLRHWDVRTGVLATFLPLAAAAAIGMVLVVLGTTRPYQPLLRVHIWTAVAGSTIALAWLIDAARRRPAGRARWALAAAVVAAAAAGVWATIEARGYEQKWRTAYRLTNPEVVPVRMDDEGAGSSSPFFPSSANTNVNGIIPANFFMTSEMCGRCHRDIYDQWKSSTHHFSSFNNQWYRKSIEYMQDMIGTTPSKWCAGCHDHAVFFNGRFDRPIREQIQTPEAQAGLGCTSCHAVTRVNSTMGQGDFVVEYPPLHDLATSENPLLRVAHDRLIDLDPQPHRETFLKPFHREQTAQFCSSCHKVHLDVPVNGYRWFRGFNDYDNWQASGISGEGARSFYYPPKSQKCTDCHMPQVRSNDPAAKNGLVKSHRFPGANTALPFVNHDAEQLKTVQDFLRDGQISIDVFGLVRTAAPVPPIAGAAAPAARPSNEPKLSTTFAVGEESMSFGAADASLRPADDVVAPLDRVKAWVRRGESARIEVVVRTRKVGHFFPGGTVDAFDVWVELEAVDDRGRTLLHSGSLQDRSKGPVEPGAHMYRALLLDEHGNPINKRNAWAGRSAAYVRLIPPGAADTVHFRLDVPPDAGDRIHIKARVNYRKFAWWNTQWSFAGVRDPADPHFTSGRGYDDGRWAFTGDTSKVSGDVKAIPEIPITAMAESTATLEVVDRNATVDAVAPFVGPAVRERWNDYGIGLLLQGHLKGAEAVFEKVTQMDPDYADGFVNVGRARLQEGNLKGAEETLRRALIVDPDLAKSHFFLGTVLKNDGRYDEAMTHLRAAATRYPRDRVVRNQLGHLLFLQRRFDDAIAEFKHVLQIDPEDLQAHYTLMLCYQGAGQKDAAERERRLYLRFKADESAQAITGPYRQLHPDDNNERQAIHEHRSAGAVRPPSR